MMTWSSNALNQSTIPEQANATVNASSLNPLHYNYDCFIVVVSINITTTAVAATTATTTTSTTSTSTTTATFATFFCYCFFGFLEGFGTAPDSKEMGRKMGYGWGGYHMCIYVYRYMSRMLCIYCRPPVNPYCLVPLSGLGYTPYINGSKRVVGYQVVGAYCGSTNTYHYICILLYTYLFLLDYIYIYLYFFQFTHIYILCIYTSIYQDWMP